MYIYMGTQHTLGEVLGILGFNMELNTNYLPAFLFLNIQ